MGQRGTISLFYDQRQSGLITLTLEEDPTEKSMWPQADWQSAPWNSSNISAGVYFEIVINPAVLSLSGSQNELPTTLICFLLVERQ